MSNAGATDDISYIWTRLNPRWLLTGATAGTLAGRYWVGTVESPSVVTLPGTKKTDITFGFGPIVLRGASESLALNFNGVALPVGMSVQCSFEWVER